MKQMTPLRKAFSDLNNALPDSIFDHALIHSCLIAVWKEIDKAEQLIAKGEVAEKYVKQWDEEFYSKK